MSINIRIYAVLPNGSIEEFHCVQTPTRISFQIARSETSIKDYIAYVATLKDKEAAKQHIAELYSWLWWLNDEVNGWELKVDVE